MDEKKPSRLYFIGKKEDLIQAKRTTVTLDGRDILIIYHQRKFYAMDLQCYREWHEKHLCLFFRTRGRQSSRLSTVALLLSMCANNTSSKSPEPEVIYSGPIIVYVCFFSKQMLAVLWRQEILR